MKYFNVKVNGNLYEVEVEEVSGFSGTQAQTGAPVPVSPVPAAKPAAAPAAALVAAPASGSGHNIESPMPGKILDIKVSVGDTVKENQPVVILEAMKMENEIVTPYAGRVSQIKVTKGQSVNSGELILTITD